MDKIKVSEIREKFPMYGDLSDDQLLISLRKKYYSDIPANKFYSNIDYDTERERRQKELVDSMSTTEKMLAGAGKSFSDIGRSAKRLANMAGIGSYDEAAAKADEALDKPLMDTTAGAWGKGLTDAALTFVPGLGAANKITQGVQAGARLLPRAIGSVTRGAAPYVGAAGSGALIGAATSPEDMSGGATTGALAGTAGEAGGRVLSAAYSGGKAAVEPLWQAGRERILKRTLDRFATDPAKVRAAAANPVEYVPGVTPTLAEATMDPGIAQLQRGAASASPDVASALAQARGQQVAGYRSTLDDLAGNDGKREFYDTMRNKAAEDLYGQAYAGGLSMTTPLEAQVKELMQRPSIQAAMVNAQRLAREKGMNLDSPGGSVAGLHYVKKSLDDMISAAKRAGNNNEASALIETQSNLVDFLRQASPKYGEALDTFKAMSRPINQMDIGQTLRDKALPALTDLGDGSLARVNANSYANALRNADQTAKKATGMTGAKMESVMDPAQMDQITGIGKDMARYASAQELARVPGSPTAQYLGAQNVVRQFLGPLGIPQSAADSMVGRLASGLMGLPFKVTQSQTEQLLARALTDPKIAAKIMAAKDPKTIAEILRPYAAQAAIQADTQ
jgi:hypothetical protein